MKQHYSIIIVGGNQFAMEAALHFAAEQEAGAKIITAFKNDPIPIMNYKQDQVDPVFYQREPSKFFDKPKNNFKK